MFDANQKRREILKVWRQLRATRSDAGWVSIIERAKALGLDLDFPSADGESIMCVATQRGYERAVKLLLQYKVDTGMQVSAMVSWCDGLCLGSTTLTIALSRHHDRRATTLGTRRCILSSVTCATRARHASEP